MAKPVEHNTLAVASLFSGKLLTDFDKMHKTAEDLMGCPVLTHQIPRVHSELSPMIADFCPEVAAFDYSDVNTDTVATKARELVELAGRTQAIRTPLIADQKCDPMEDIPRGMDVQFIDPKTLGK